jgi:stearoyl-CoA desaturase (delta-9 desaturase)
MQDQKKINWLNTLFLTINPLVAIVGTIILACLHMIHWQTVLLAVILAIMGGISITAGYHRLFSHRAYKAAWPVRFIFLLFGAATFEGSILEWCTDHRKHHLYTDTPKDPYSIKGGFWYAHIGWLFTLDPSKRTYSNVTDLQKDPLVRFQHRFYLVIAIMIGYVLPVLIALCWGDWIGGLLIAGALRITFSQHTTFFVNSACHFFGKSPYSDKHTARDNWVTALFTFGEGYHNFHHQFPFEYRNAIRFYQYDPTKWLIRTLAFFGLASDLKTVSKQKILKYKITMDQKKLSENPKSSLHNLYETIMHMLTKTDHLEEAYQKLKSSRLADLKLKADEYKVLLKNHHDELKLLKFKLRILVKEWQYSVSQKTSSMGLS